MRAEPPTEGPRRLPPRRVSSLVLLNTGHGKGKSTAAFGTMIRAVARGWNVSVIQFIKSGKWRVGEEEIGRRLGVDWWSIGDGFT
ncbi:MAG TPA: cob(I)yrinic acid a,c-diamide adenosyltransferase, partial [Actinomycetota bacterium]|nr:cob(I)yrinic acid a,c-diamide adenosyltransferase [Actinomycetota bacterium]